jgi:glycosyltransferase involved in cell wall biosynthesis
MRAFKVIALVEWNWMGHHPMYFTLFVRALLALDYVVVGMCPEPDEVRNSVVDLGPATLGKLTLVKIGWRNAPRMCPMRLKRLAETIRSVLAIRRAIWQWEKAAKQSVNLIFFTCIYDVQMRLYRYAEWLLPYRWSGLYLHCRWFRKPGSTIPQNGELPCPELIFNSRRLHSVAILDEGAKTALEALIGRKVVVFPDLTDESLPSAMSPLERSIEQRASGSPVVSAIGQLQYTKGVTTLARVAANPKYNDLTFAFIGEVAWGTFTTEDRNLLLGLRDGGNVYTHFERVSGESAFNSVVRVSDVVVAAYIDFPNSSGILTKAALLEKPVVVSDGHLMAERVRAYDIGEVVPEGDAEATGNAIRRILTDRVEWCFKRKRGWEKYMKDHSYDALKKALTNLLDPRR